MRRWSILKIAVSGLIAVFSTTAALAEVKLPAVISDNMVLQAGKPVPIWGWDDPKQQVTVVCTSAGTAGRSATAQAGQDGRWQVTLPAFSAGQSLEISVKDSTSAKTVKNVLVGEVWAAPGQSNMQWTVRLSDNFEQEAAEAKYPKLRMFSVTRETADEPKCDCQGRWIECSPETVGDFSAAGYFFGRYLHKEMKVPVAIINTSWGGTPAEAWTSRPGSHRRAVDEAPAGPMGSSDRRRRQSRDAEQEAAGRLEGGRCEGEGREETGAEDAAAGHRPAQVAEPSGQPL